MDTRDLLEDDADPVPLLEALLERMSSDLPPTERMTLAVTVVELLARAPLPATDVFAPIIRSKLGLTKDTLRVQVHAARSALPRTTNPTAENFEPTDEDLAAAEAILHAPKIEDRFTADMHRLGVVGETLNLTLLLLVVISRLLKKPISLAFKSASSAGKSFLMNTVLLTLPPGECVVFTAASAKALYYRTESLAHKVLAFMERPGVEENDYQVRVLQSEGKLVYAVAEKDPSTGQIVTVERVIEGPLAYIETTTQAMIHDENETRLFSASLDEGPAATQQIISEQARRAAQGDAEDADGIVRIWRALHSLLRPASVVIPFAELIPRHFPTRLVRARRDFPRFLALIEASALLYQHQRERNERGAVVATLDDYELARRLAAPLLESALRGVGPKTLEAVAAARELAVAERPGDPTEVTITTSKVAKRLPDSGWSKSTVRRHLKAADDAGYLDLVSAPKGRDHEYRLVRLHEDISVFLPKACDLLTDAAPAESRQPDQGVPNHDGTPNPNPLNEIVGVNHVNQGVRGDRPLFTLEPSFQDPDFQ